MNNSSIIFYISAFLIISFAIFSVMSKKIINSLLWAVLVFFTAAVLFYLLGSEYNAIIQAAIYGFAVPVILGLSIMFSAGKIDSGKNFKFSLSAIIFAILFLLLFVDSVVISFVKLHDSFPVQEAEITNFYSIISVFANGLFIRYLWAFELTGLLLTVIITGITLIAERRGRWICRK